MTEAEWVAAVAELRPALLQVQRELAVRKAFPVVVLLAGLDGAGKGLCFNALNDWLDPRHLHTQGFTEPTDEELQRPHMWRYWRTLPPRGKMAIFDGSWYHWPILQRVHGKIRPERFQQDMEQVRAFERMLVDEGALVLKFWMHLGKRAQKARLGALEKDPATRWQVTARDWMHHGLHEAFRQTAERARTLTHEPEAPWIVLDAEDSRRQQVAVGRLLLEHLRSRLERPPMPPEPLPQAGTWPMPSVDLGSRVDLLSYPARLQELQGRLAALVRHRAMQQHAVVLVFEGPAASGIREHVRTLSQAIDARHCHVHAPEAPSEEALDHPYLWRFWRLLPRQGHVAIFEGSWYQRVLEDRVEGTCAERDWVRAYGEISAFEAQLVASRALVVKYWVEVSPDEQLRRLRQREEGPVWMRPEPSAWRERAMGEAYRGAAGEMLARTEVPGAPWVLIASEDERAGRLAILEDLCHRLEHFLEVQGRRMGALGD